MRMGKKCLLALAVSAGMCAGAALGQQKAAANANPNAGPAAYDIKREVSLTGTVQSYTAAAQTPPLGAHVMLLTSSGPVDIHVGDARLLTASHFTIKSGDSLRIIGENVAHGKGTQFVARIIQKGTQVLEVRSIRGLPMSYVAPRTGATAKAQGGVL